MRNSTFIRRAALVAALSCAVPAFADGFRVLPDHGVVVNKTCSKADTVTGGNCLVASLPGEDGYALSLSRSASIVRNEVEIGMLFEQVWQNQADPTLYIFGAQITLNANASDASGLPFNVNDVFRQTLHRRFVQAAYFPVDGADALRSAGRTVQGLNEFDGQQPELARGWTDFRVHVNAADPQGVSVPNSPWLLMKARAPKGIELNPFGIRLLDSDVDNPKRDAVDLFIPSYQPVGVPPPGDDDDATGAPRR